MIWGCGGMFIVGIDVAKRNHEVTVITSEGQVVCKAFRISNTCTGYNRMMERLGKLTNLKGQFIFAVEFTATTGWPCIPVSRKMVTRSLSSTPSRHTPCGRCFSANQKPI